MCLNDILIDFDFIVMLLGDLLSDFVFVIVFEFFVASFRRSIV